MVPPIGLRKVFSSQKTFEKSFRIIGPSVLRKSGRIIATQEKTLSTVKVVLPLPQRLENANTFAETFATWEKYLKLFDFLYLTECLKFERNLLNTVDLKNQTLEILH